MFQNALPKVLLILSIIPTFALPIILKYSHPCPSPLPFGDCGEYRMGTVINYFVLPEIILTGMNLVLFVREWRRTKANFTIYLALLFSAWPILFYAMFLLIEVTGDVTGG